MAAHTELWAIWDVDAPISCAMLKNHSNRIGSSTPGSLIGSVGHSPESYMWKRTSETARAALFDIAARWLRCLRFDSCARYWLDGKMKWLGVDCPETNTDSFGALEFLEDLGVV